MEAGHGILLSPAYPGNGTWVLVILFAGFMLFRVISTFRRKRIAGEKVDAKEFFIACLFPLGFLALGVFQLLSNNGMSAL